MNLHNTEAIALWNALGDVSPEDRLKMLDKEAKKVGLQRCKLAEQAE